MIPLPNARIAKTAAIAAGVGIGIGIIIGFAFAAKLSAPRSQQRL